MRSTPKNPTITKNVIDAIQAYFRSVYGGIIHRNLWKDVNTYCLFIGYPRSGHSLIGALLNAHPNMMVAHELGALKYVYAGFSKWQIYYLLMKKAQLSGEKGRKLGGYIYDVPNQWQGRVKNLQVTKIYK